jgi:hypothetical protein
MKLNSECPICYEKMTKNNHAKTICGHEFCLSCLIQHSKNHENCPLCRNDLIKKKAPTEKQTTLNDAINIIENEIETFNLDEQLVSAQGINTLKSIIQMFSLNVIHSYLVQKYKNRVHPSWNFLEFQIDDSNESIEEAGF